MQAVHSELLSLPLLFVLEELTLPVCRLPCFRPPCSSLQLRRLQRDLQGKVPVLFSSALLPFPSPQHPLSGSSCCDSAQNRTRWLLPRLFHSACVQPALWIQVIIFILHLLLWSKAGLFASRCHQLSPNKLTQQTYWYCCPSTPSPNPPLLLLPFTSGLLIQPHSPPRAERPEMGCAE